MPTSLPVVNLSEAKFECIFGRGCDGICCREGRPPISPEDAARIESVLEKALPELRPAARKLVEKEGYVSGRRKLGQPMLRVIDGWCVFFNQGCVLHKIGAQEGEAYKYKPVLCSVFPLSPGGADGNWYVRQKGYEGETWDLFCLDPAASSRRASETLQEEVRVLERHLDGERQREGERGASAP